MAESIHVCPECGEPLETRQEICPMCGTLLPREEPLSHAEGPAHQEEKYPVNSMLDVFCFITTVLLSLLMIPIFPPVGALALLLGLPIQAVVTNNAYSTLQKYGPDDPRSESALLVRTLMKIYAAITATLFSVAIAFFCVCMVG